MIASTPLAGLGRSFDLLRLYPVRLLVLAGGLWETRRLVYGLLEGLFHTTADGLLTRPPATVAPAAAMVATLFLAVYVLGARVVEGRAADELRLAGSVRGVAAGFAAGAAAFTAVFCAIAAQGCVAYRGYGGLGGVASIFLVLAAAALAEELIFRGLVFRILDEALGAGPALALSGLVFAGAHLGNSGVTALAVLSAFGLGVVCALLYRLTGALWVPVGLHFGWNFTQGAVFGSAISGHDAQGLWRFSLSGPAWATGGAFGPESTVYTVILMSAAAVALTAVAAQRRVLTPLRFRLRAP